MNASPKTEKPNGRAVLAIAMDPVASRVHLAFIPGGNGAKGDVRQTTVSLDEKTTAWALRQGLRELGWRGQSGDMACLLVPSEEGLVHVEEFPTADSNEARNMTEGIFNALLGSDSGNHIPSIQILHRGSARTVCALAVFKKERLEKSFATLRKLGVENALFVLDSMAAWQTEPSSVREGYYGRISRMEETGRSMASLLKIQEGVIRSVRQRYFDRTFADSSEAASVVDELFPEEVREGVSSKVHWHLNGASGKAEGLAEIVRLGAQDGLIAFEMQPDFWREQMRQDRNRQRGFVIAGALAIVYLLFLFYLGGASLFTWHEEKRIQGEMQRETPFFKEAMELDRQLASVRASRDPASSALEVLRQMGENLPEGMTLENFSFRFQDSLKLRGVSTQSDRVYDFVGKLRKIPSFRNAKVDSVGNNPSGGGVSWQVSIPLAGRVKAKEEAL